MKLKEIEELDLEGKRVLLRADLNVTFKPNSTEIADDTRIRESIATIQFLQQRNAKTLICSHVGRPKGKAVPDLKIEHVRTRLQDLLGAEIQYVGGPCDESIAEALKSAPNGSVAILENLRFHPGEKANDPKFATYLASLADYFINDAFGVSHREHASIAGIAKATPVYAGLLMRAETEMLNRAIESDEHPFVAVIGGAKVADKLPVVENLAKKADSILIGGGMTAAFQAAQGLPHGETELSSKELNAAESLLKNPETADKLVIPIDITQADRFAEDSRYVLTHKTWASEKGYILDIGPWTMGTYIHKLAHARKIIWNGPVGLFEWKPFSAGTVEVAHAIARNNDAFTLAGGGSTVEAIQTMNLTQHFTHISTGGGASLEFLEGKTLPSIASLQHHP